MDEFQASMPAPLKKWEDGSLRVAGSRVTLESVVHAFRLGETAEQIQDSFPSLALKEIYGAIYYYLENTTEIETYLSQREQLAEEGRRFIDSHFDTAALRKRLCARRDQLVQR